MIRQILIRIREKILEEERKEERREQLIQSGNYIVSKNANMDNILIDTCAMQSKKGLYIIEKSRRANILYATLEEIDKKKVEIIRKRIKEPRDNEFIANVAKCMKEIIQNPKFKVILVRNKCGEYVDNIILKYLKRIPKRKRPTLLTEDKVLAAKAKGMGIEYICIIPDVKKKTEVRKVENSETKKVVSSKKQPKNIESKSNKVKVANNQKSQKVNVSGKAISYTKGGSLKIKSYSNDSKVFLVKADECEELKLDMNKENIIEKEFDYLVATIYLPKYKRVRLTQIIFGEETKKEVYECQLVNEIYQIPLHEEILEKAKNQLVSVTY